MLRCPGSLIYREPLAVASMLYNEYSFLKYAASNLFFHVAEAHKAMVSQNQLFEQFCLEDSALSDMASRLNTLHVLSYYAKRKMGNNLWPLVVESESKTSLAYSLVLHGSLNSKTLFEALLSSTKDPSLNLQGGFFDTPLQAASTRGLYEIARALMDKGAQIDLQGGTYGTALQAAIAQKHRMVADFLLEKGANVNVQGGVYGNALQAAVVVQDEGMVTKLLSLGADVNAQGGKYGTSLQAAIASWEQSHQIVFLLLKSHADPNLTGGLYGSALQAAMACEYYGAVNILLRQRADVNVQGGLVGNILHIASERAKHNVVKKVLWLGTNVNIRGRHCSFIHLRNEIERWCDNEWAEAFDLKDIGLSGECISRDAVTRENRDFYHAGPLPVHVVDETPLHCAVWSRDTNFVKFLVEQGADVNATSGILRTTLPFEGLLVSSSVSLSIVVVVVVVIFNVYFRLP